MVNLFLITFIIPLTPIGSRFEVGSSKIIILGFIVKTEAIATLCFSPPVAQLDRAQDS
ncbi:unnamed protein product [marine sediment metagenome]|uniref:Uncharacterized protein n=1 Tax=marine sediment metagenome TaxID=412755 RepID=X1CN80_9ZZZZ